VRFEIPLRILELAALMWALGVILAWQVPLLYPVVRVE
jgi:hypothetical protein